MKSIDIYYLNPHRCKQCNTTIEYKKRSNIFCSRSCAAKYNNIHRDYKPTPKHKLKTSNSIKTSIINNNHKRTYQPKFYKIKWHTCNCCGKIFYTRGWYKIRSSCGSPECI